VKDRQSSVRFSSTKYRRISRKVILKVPDRRVFFSQANKITSSARGFSAILLLFTALLLDVKILSLLYECRNYQSFRTAYREFPMVTFRDSFVNDYFLLFFGLVSRVIFLIEKLHIVGNNILYIMPLKRKVALTRNAIALLCNDYFKISSLSAYRLIYTTRFLYAFYPRRK